MQTLKSTTQTKEVTTNTFDTNLKPPIFILGSGRSGTSLLRSILNNHPDIYCMEGETHLFSPESNPYLEELEFFQSSNDIKSLTFTIISSILFGSTYKAASPPTSGILDTFEVITGTPQLIASKIGIPNPSYKLG